MTLDERIAASIARNPNATNCKIAKNVKGATAGDVARVRESGGLPQVSKTGRTLDAFRAVHDVMHIIERNVGIHLKDSAEEYFTDHEFRELCGVPSGNWRRFADDTAFSEHRLIRGSHNLWASKKMIREMRRILGI